MCTIIFLHTQKTNAKIQTNVAIVISKAYDSVYLYRVYTYFTNYTTSSIDVHVLIYIYGIISSANFPNCPYLSLNTYTHILPQTRNKYRIIMYCISTCVTIYILTDNSTHIHGTYRHFFARMFSYTKPHHDMNKVYTIRV